MEGGRTTGKNKIKNKLKIEVNVNIERAHRVGKLRPQPTQRHDGSEVKIRSRPSMPPIMEGK